MADPDDANRPGELPVIDPEAFYSDDADLDRSVAGAVLAAGESRRFGDRNKLLAEVGGESIVRHAVETLVAAPVDPVTVVVGHEAQRVAAAVDDLPVTIAVAGDHDRGHSAAVRTAVDSVPDDADALAIALGDTPAVAPATVAALVRAYEAGAGSALAAACDGRRGNPVLFDRRHFDALAAVEGDRGGRGVLLGADDAALVETGDPGVLADVDRPGDVDRARELLADDGR